MKLLCSENSKHSSHVGTIFARSTIRHLDEVAGFLGSEEITFHSQDDKANIPIKLHDYNFVIAMQHKMVPSVIGDMQVKAKTFSSDAVTYSGLTYIGIRSAKTSRVECV